MGRSHLIRVGVGVRVRVRVRVSVELAHGEVAQVARRHDELGELAARAQRAIAHARAVLG